MVKYEKKEIGGGGDILGNRFNLNYKGSNKCPNGYYWVNGYYRKQGIFGKVYVAGHCRKVGTVEVENKVNSCLL